MIGMVLLIVSGFGALVWNSYRSDRRRAEEGEGFAPEGKLRWSSSSEPPEPPGRRERRE